ncbi:MAG: OPT/YSL family transporter, partial [Isosphaeraceae bacterium]
AEPGRYLVDPESGAPRYRVDPGINGIVKTRADGTEATKFTPAQPALFAVIIDGIMTGQLPWVLVVLGAFLAIVMQLAGVSALAFAVGVYLPLATTAPIFIGGLVRAVVDRYHKMTPEESDSSPAILMSSGLIAGGSIAGILMALREVAPPLKRGLDLSAWLPKGWNEWPGPALAAFGLLVVILLRVGLKTPSPAVEAASPDLAKPGEISNDDK